MPYFVYISSQCRDDIRKHGMAAEVERLRLKIEKEQSLAMLDRFPQPYLKKRLGRTRLVIEERRLPDDANLVCFARLVYRGEADYANFLAIPSSLTTTYEIDEQEARQYVADCLAGGVVAREKLSQVEEAYLYGHTATPHEEYGLVLETLDWVERMQDPRRKDYKLPFGKVVEAIITSQDGNKTVRHHPEYPQVGVLFRYYPEARRLLLLAPVDNEADERAMRGKYARVFDGDLPADELLRLSRRAYPSIITIDHQLWLNTQSTIDANLALSPEESGIVEEIRATATGCGNRAFPLFINGRPGSGKSTILQYLFADALFFHLTRTDQERLLHPPVYLTYSPQLLSRAQKVVEAILRCDASKQLDAGALSDERLQQVATNCFANFRDFLRSLLPEPERERFADARFIGFPQFRTMWRDRFDRAPDRALRDLSPEVGWHVIRSYIKGMREDNGDYFDVECYREHPAKRQSVTSETFRLVYERVFQPWYAPLCEREGYWDDQDLVRAVLGGDLEAISRHPAVFCDEAQDFTALELQLIFHLSIYSRRLIPRHLLHRVPFAFAGDPFQTLNPTGFTWSGVRADFHEKIVENLDRSSSRSLDFNFRELKLNYRSGDAIVKLCNSIQLARGVLFEIRGVEPQKTWFLEPASIPAFFDIEEATIRRMLEEQEELVVIVPCHEGGELEFVRADPLLSEIALQEGKLARNILSPMRAKGLEFQRVVLYGFGAQSLQVNGVLDALSALRPLGLDREEQLPAEYYFNQLYVGASRARSRLLIVDSKAGLERLWSLFSRQDGAQRLLDGYRRVEPELENKLHWSTVDLGRIVPGEQGDVEGHRDDQREVADKFFEQGRDKQDPYFLELARNLYQRLSDRTQAEECSALILEFGGQLREAGKIYVELRKFSSALRCFWRSAAWSELIHLTDPATERTPEMAAARFMSGRRPMSAAAQLLGEMNEFFTRPDAKAKLLSDPRWSEIAIAVTEALATAAERNDEGTADDWKRLLAQVEACRFAGLRLPDSVSIARIAHRVGQMDLTVKIWRAAAPRIEAPPWLLEALGTVEPYPSNLEFLARLERWQEVLRQFENRRDTRLGENASRSVKDAAMHAGWTPATLALIERDPREEHLLSVLYGPATDALRPHAEKAASLLMGLLDRPSRWTELLGFVRTRSFKGQLTRNGALIHTLTPGALRALLIRLLARSQVLAAEGRQSMRKQISDYLQAEVVDASHPQSLGCTVYEAAAAVERAGLITQALQFYEGVLKELWGKDERFIAFARERWLYNKMRQIDVVPEKTKGRVQQELEKSAELWRVPLATVRKLPRFPEAPDDEPGPTTPAAKEARTTGGEGLKVALGDRIAPLAVAESRPEPPRTTDAPGLPEVLTTDDRTFAVRHRPDLRKLELRDQETDQSIVIRGAQGDLRSAEMEDVLEVSNEAETRIYDIRPWRMSVRLAPAGTRLHVRVLIVGVTMLDLNL